MEDLEVARILRLENFEWQKELCQAEFAEDPDLN